MLPSVKVLFIIVTYNGMPWLERCLGSVVAQAAPDTQVDLFVVDNDSTDGSADFVEARFPQAKLTRCAENLGFTAANNLGFEYAMRKSYDYVYLLNQDAWLEEGALAALLEAAAAHPEYAVLSPLQLQADGVSFDPKFGKLMKRACVSEILPLRFVMAAHWLVPVKALREIGTFAELFPIYGQDDNWCDRARCHGWKIGVVPSARAIHDRATRAESKERILERNYRNASLVRLADINRPLWQSWLYVCLFTPVQAIKYRSWTPFRLFPSLCWHNAGIKALRHSTKNHL